MGTPVALRLARALLVGEPELRTVLLVAACRESYLLDYANGRSRFMFNFGDGAVAGLLAADPTGICCSDRTSSPRPMRRWTAAGTSSTLPDPAEMKGGLGEVSLSNVVAAAEDALARSGATLGDVSYVCGIHMKRSMHEAIAAALGVPLGRVSYLADTGHMSGVDPLLGLDRAVRAGDVSDGDLVLLLVAGTGCTGAASVVRWGPAPGHV
jgi:3-oxoacyl-[acyl-carrier-protein] synthase-3